MTEATLQPWWAFALRGVAAIAFGILAALWPGITLLVLVALFAAYALVGGAVTIFGAVGNRSGNGDWWFPVLIGLIGIGAGAVAFLHPALTALILVLLIGVHALLIGIFDLVSAARERQPHRANWLVALSGVASVLFAALIFLFPGTGALAVVWLISLYAIFTGLLLVTAAFQMRQRRGGFTGRERRINPDRRSHAH
jgi:uncharacterized membrane protein HdeD (DUF308 family)